MAPPCCAEVFDPSLAKGSSFAVLKHCAPYGLDLPPALAGITTWTTGENVEGEGGEITHRRSLSLVQLICIEIHDHLFGPAL